MLGKENRRGGERRTKEATLKDKITSERAIRLTQHNDSATRQHHDVETCSISVSNSISICISSHIADLVELQLLAAVRGHGVLVATQRVTLTAKDAVEGSVDARERP